MKRHLYILLPDTVHTRNVVDELETSDIERRHMHVIAAQDVDPDGLPVDPPLRTRPRRPARRQRPGWLSCN